VFIEKKCLKDTNGLNERIEILREIMKDKWLRSAKKQLEGEGSAGITTNNLSAPRTVLLDESLF